MFLLDKQTGLYSEVNVDEKVVFGFVEVDGRLNLLRYKEFEVWAYPLFTVFEWDEYADSLRYTKEYVVGDNDLPTEFVGVVARFADRASTLAYGDVFHEID